VLYATIAQHVHVLVAFAAVLFIGIGRLNWVSIASALPASSEKVPAFEFNVSAFPARVASSRSARLITYLLSAWQAPGGCASAFQRATDRTSTPSGWR
jgi:hypothetical protein